jgi:cyanophycinase
MPRPIALALTVAFTLTTGCIHRGSPAATVDATTARRTGTGTLFIVGGGSTPATVTQEFVRLAGGPGAAKIIVFAMASAAGERSGEAKAEDLRTLGAAARNVWIDHAQADLDSVARLLDDATGIWFGGGDQNRLLDVLRNTRTARAITARFQAGAVVGGTSAGAAIMSTPMITGDELARRDTTESWTRVARGTVAVDSGLGLLTEAVVDQHFLRRRRHNRLLSLVLADAPHVGVGIDEGTALIVEPTGRWRVIGVSSAFVVDARGASRTGTSAAVLGAANMRLHLLPAGSTFDPRTGTATLPR